MILVNIAMFLPFPDKVKDNVSTVQRTEANKGQEGVSEMWYLTKLPTVTLIL